jgi:hypothetical protein
VIPTLPSTTTALVSSLAESKTSLSRARLAATAAYTAHQQQHTELLTVLINLLETKHNLVSTSSELRASVASLESQTWAAAAEGLLWETRQLAYPAEARTALAHYRHHLRDAGRRLEDGARVREVELADYGVATQKVSSHGHNRRKSLDLLAAGGMLRGREGREHTRPADQNKERTMREMARVWREMETRLREIEGDLNRLR